MASKVSEGDYDFRRSPFQVVVQCCIPAEQFEPRLSSQHSFEGELAAPGQIPSQRRSFEQCMLACSTHLSLAVGFAPLRVFRQYIDLLRYGPQGQGVGEVDSTERDTDFSGGAC